MWRRILLSLFLLNVWACAQAKDVITLRVMALPENRQIYYTKLLEQALRAEGVELHLNYLTGIPQPRIWDMVGKNEISLVWGVQTSARDREYAFIDNQLTNGLIGQRILLVKKGNENAFAGVRSLDDFRRTGTVGGMGAGWYDVEVWQRNSLRTYVKTGDWRQLFPMVASGERGIDYIVRGVTEISSEARNYQGLGIEANLLLTHDRDMRFYLSPDSARHKAIIENALIQADRNGLKKKLIAEYLLPELRDLNLEKRQKLKLVMPPH